MNYRLKFAHISYRTFTHSKIPYMNRSIAISFILLLILTIISCQNNVDRVQDMSNYYAWCIVPYDNQERTPEQRIEMLKELNIRSYAYDWRTKHLPEMAHEMQLAKQNSIDIMAVWMWISASDSINNLSDDNNAIMQVVQDAGLKTQIWVGMSEDFFEGLSEDRCFEKSQAFLSYLSKQAADLGCTIGLYNHGGWFGNPINQVKLIQSLPDREIGIVFNFHHAHDMLDEFPKMVKIMKPYLWAVNLNGMRAGGPKILPIGEGDREKEMILTLESEGFIGPYGILGHVEDADVQVVLQKNLDGLASIMP